MKKWRRKIEMRQINAQEIQRYNSGEEIHVGDHVSYFGIPVLVVVVFVNDTSEYSEGFSAKDWSHLGRWCGKRTGSVYLECADEDLKFEHRFNFYAPCPSSVRTSRLAQLINADPCWPVFSGGVLFRQWS